MLTLLPLLFLPSAWSLRLASIFQDGMVLQRAPQVGWAWYGILWFGMYFCVVMKWFLIMELKRFCRLPDCSDLMLLTFLLRCFKFSPSHPLTTPRLSSPAP